MRKFQCLSFVLKQSYFLLHNLHDCTFNDSFQFFWVFLIISWKGALLFTGGSFLIEGGHPWGASAFMGGGGRFKKIMGWGAALPLWETLHSQSLKAVYYWERTKLWQTCMCPEIPSESLLLSEFFPNSIYCYQKIHSKQ